MCVTFLSEVHLFGSIIFVKQFLLKQMMNSPSVEDISILTHKYNLPLDWMSIYSTAKKVWSNRLAFFSIAEMIDQDHSTQVDPINVKFLDVCMVYKEMGYVYVLSWEPVTQTVFFRHDGGSSSVDRNNNYNRYDSPNFNPSLECHIDNRFSFSDGLEILSRYPDVVITSL